MIIYGICKSCHNHLHLYSKVNTRTGLSEEIGEQSTINCKRCGVTTKFTINEFKAKLPKRIRYAIIETILVSIVIMVLIYVITLNIWYTLFIIGLYTILAFAYVLYTRRNYDTALYFNENKI